MADAFSLDCGKIVLSYSVFKKKFDKHLEEKDEIDEQADKAMKAIRSSIKAFVVLNGFLASIVHANMHCGFLWVVGIVDVCYFLGLIQPFIRTFQKLNMLAVVEDGLIRRQKGLNVEIGECLQESEQEPKKVADKKPFKKHYEKRLKVLLKQSAATVEVKNITCYKLMYAYVVLQAFVHGVLVPLISHYILCSS